MLNHDSRGIEKKFILSIILTSLILVAEVIGGIWSGSLALLSDAGHVFSDIFALALSYLALRLANRPPDDRHSYGWHRAEVLSALVNGISLFIIALTIWVEAFKRWQNPVEIRSMEMLVIAVIGLAVNLFVALILGRHEHSMEGEVQKKPRNLNIHSAFLHVVGDLISSLGVIIAALLIRITSARWIDPLVSILIGIIILISAYRVTRKSLHILVEGVPEGLSTYEINASIRSIQSVLSVHDLHVWNICSDHVALSAHVVISEGSNTPDRQVMDEIKDVLQARYAISHTTIQFEKIPCGEGHGGCN